ncbi:hypothetical protein Golob_001310, partial [Gossypium lobatum]|nr:hypothetical protein [Gossypium lobatum]
MASAVASVAKKKTAGSKKSKSAPSHPPFLEMISDAIVSLKERTGSSQYAIAKFIEEKHKQLPANFRKVLLVQTKKFVASGKLVKVKASFKLPSASAAAKKPAAVAKKPAAAKPKSATTTAAAKSKPKATKTASKPKAKAKVGTPVKAKAKVAAKPKATTTKAKAKPAAKPTKVAKTAKKSSPGKKVKVPAKKTVAVKKPKSVKSPAKKAAPKKAKKWCKFDGELGVVVEFRSIYVVCIDYIKQ